MRTDSWLQGRRKRRQVLDKKGRPIPLAKYGLHALRHAAAALFIEQDFAPKRVQAIMGHSSIQTTAISSTIARMTG